MLSALLFAALLASPAHAGVTVHVGFPGLHVAINPWAPAYRPAPRAGYTWVAGHYDRYGAFVPGRWVPTHARAGYAWVDGYWNGAVWVDGYWRPVARVGYTWVDGYYRNGLYVAGYWSAPAAHAAAVRAAEVHRANAVHAAVVEDRIEDRHAAHEVAEARAEARAGAHHVEAESSRGHR